MSAEAQSDDTQQNTIDREELLDRACCPRCGDENLEIVKSLTPSSHGDHTIYGYKVKHASDPCSRRKWPVYDPEIAEDEYLGNGLSVCRTCLSSTQHIEHDGYDEEGRGRFKTVEPTRDEAGEIICVHCDRRTRPKSEDKGDLF